MFNLKIPNIISLPPPYSWSVIRHKDYPQESLDPFPARNKRTMNSSTNITNHPAHKTIFSLLEATVPILNHYMSLCRTVHFSSQLEYIPGPRGRDKEIDEVLLVSEPERS